MKAIVLGSGESLSEYKENYHKDSYVIAVNATWAKLPEGAKIDLVTMQDGIRDFRKVIPHFFDIDPSIKCLAYNPNWKDWASRRGNCEIAERRVNTFDADKVVHERFRLNGKMSVITAIFEAIRQGATDVCVFGHDCSTGHNSHSSNRINATIKELNFCHRILKNKGGGLKLASSSYLWKYSTPDAPILECDKYEKPKRKVTVKKIIDKVDSDE